MSNMTIGITKYNNENDGYPEFADLIKAQFTFVVNNGPLFMTTQQDLFGIFLENLPEDARPHYTCTSCRRFVNAYGGLVTADPTGKPISAIWMVSDPMPDIFKQSVAALKKAVEKTEITGVFVTTDINLGEESTNGWDHMHVQMPRERLFNVWNKTPKEVMDDAKQEFEMLKDGALEKFKATHVDKAVALLQNELLDRSEKFIGMAMWFKSLRDAIDSTKNTRHQDNMIWLAVTMAPSGFCHIHNTVLGALLKDLADPEITNAGAIRRFADKVKPDVYQRPTAPPSEGNVVQAEKIIAEKGLAKSLERRFARREELQTVWTPTVFEQEKTGGIFGHLLDTAKEINTEALSTDPINITWEKLSRTVLPNALKIEFGVMNRKDAFGSIMTAVHADAPPIIQWDTEEQRNPFSWYVYGEGSKPSDWNLSLGFHEVTAISLIPPMWNDGHEKNAHHGRGIFFIIKGAKDLRHEKCGSGLFPEILRSDLREIRSTIEAHSNKTNPQGYAESTANGLILHGSMTGGWYHTFRVTTEAGTLIYLMDRWD